MKANRLSLALLLSASLLLVVASSCKKSEQDKMRDEISKQEAALYSDKTQEIDKDKALEMERLYISYADKYADDTLSAEYLFRAAEIAENAGHPNNAITYLTKIEDNHKEYRNYPLVIFKKAYVYENCLKNIDSARKYYQKFIDEYPNHELVETANASLMFLGMTDDQLIDILEKISKE